jgi:Nickel/cobalt transporter regulator
MRRVLIAMLAGLLLPGVAMAQNGPPPRPGEGQRPGGPPGRPAPGPPQGQPMPPGRPAPVTRPSYRPLPTYVRPLLPRGNQFWHRGQYYGRVPGPAFAYPRGWGYRQWLIGQRLPPLFLAPSYFYGGWAGLGLQAPPPDYSWVRYGPDLLLVNLNTGEVEDVVYGVFM